eukprot:TRINITY_DN637_c0_g1_i1.p1 TRINITY_DN637_c0_g1~~TRINITY_DN637_c0_g1_i1.p1  ORF type:complete len:410 (-),score=-5.86 TRINITY_DN637_c0_g1_i1:129-1175(-)
MNSTFCNTLAQGLSFCSNFFINQTTKRYKSEVEEQSTKVPMEALNTSLHYYSCTNSRRSVFLLNAKNEGLHKVAIDHNGGERFDSSVMLGYDLYLVGGHYGSSGRVLPTVYSVAILNSLEPHNKAVRRADLKIAREHIGLAQYRDRYIYAIGGYASPNYIASCEKYDATRDKWTLLPALNEERSIPSVCEMCGYLYVVGGCRGRAKSASTIERLNLLDEEAGWSIMIVEDPSQNWSPRNSSGMCQVSDNTMIIFGGGSAVSKKDCFVMQIEGDAIAMKEGVPLEEADSFCMNYGSVIQCGKVYSVALSGKVHSFSLKTMKWQVQSLFKYKVSQLLQQFLQNSIGLLCI